MSAGQRDPGARRSGRAVAALYQVLLNYPIDRRVDAARPGTVFGRRYRRCRVHFDADFWLRQPDEQMLLGQLVGELSRQSPRGAAGRVIGSCHVCALA
ncbi:MAG: hypothetical protein ACRDTG_06835 [Pseudonocardiaceae bacterium]